MSRFAFDFSNQKCYTDIVHDFLEREWIECILSFPSCWDVVTRAHYQSVLSMYSFVYVCYRLKLPLLRADGVTKVVLFVSG